MTPPIDPHALHAQHAVFDHGRVARFVSLPPIGSGHGSYP
jgi:hypothetical protein